MIHEYYRICIFGRCFSETPIPSWLVSKKENRFVRPSVRCDTGSCEQLRPRRRAPRADPQLARCTSAGNTSRPAPGGIGWVKPAGQRGLPDGWHKQPDPAVAIGTTRKTRTRWSASCKLSFICTSSLPLVRAMSCNLKGDLEI